jgi:hypothetical protein
MTRCLRLFRTTGDVLSEPNKETVNIRTNDNTTKSDCPENGQSNWTNWVKRSLRDEKRNSRDFS